MTRTLAVCADDFGLAPGINAAILRLARAHRLTAISCITNGAAWAAGSPQLRDLPGNVDIGLHINLTEGRPLSPRLAKLWPTLPTLPTLMARAHLGLLPRIELRHEVHAQLSAFGRARGAPPAFIDGHQHVHQLPILRDFILDMVEHVQPLPAVRSTAPLLGPGFAFKRVVIERSGGRALTRTLEAREFAHNPALLGAYDFVTTDYRGLMQRWLEMLPAAGGLLFCHPGDTAPGDPPDAIAASRIREFDYLGDEAFAADLKAADVVLGRVWRVRPPLRR